MAHHKRINNTFQTPKELQMLQSTPFVFIRFFMSVAFLQNGARGLFQPNARTRHPNAPRRHQYLSSLGNAHPLEIFNGRNRRTYLHSLESFKQLEENKKHLRALFLFRKVRSTPNHNHLKVTRTQKVWPLFAGASNNNCTSRDLVEKQLRGSLKPDQKPEYGCTSKLIRYLFGDGFPPYCSLSLKVLGHEFARVKIVVKAPALPHSF